MKWQEAVKIPAIVTQIWSLVDRSGDCWLWRGTTRDTCGPLLFCRPHKQQTQVPIRRFAFSTAHGIPHPQLIIEPKCNKKACVNPAHLVTRNRQGQVHVLVHKDDKSGTGTCQHCGPTKTAVVGKCKNGTRQVVCIATTSQKSYRQYISDKCARCGFVPEHVCQLDVHHKDHNHSNNDPANLLTMCANCHRLMHLKSKQFAIVSSLDP